jgi:hypothetical protein
MTVPPIVRLRVLRRSLEVNGEENNGKPEEVSCRSGFRIRSIC